MKKYFILGIGTEVGKTHILCEFIRLLRGRGRTVKALKPIITGLNISDNKELLESDSARIISALAEEEVTMQSISNLSLFRYEYPDSPNIAALKDGRPYINYEELVQEVKDFFKNSNKDYGFIEGVGGVMVPINKKKLFIDLLMDVKEEVILVADNYLGALNHTLLSIEALRNNKIKIAAIIFNNISGDLDSFSTRIETIREIYKDIKIFDYKHLSLFID